MTDEELKEAASKFFWWHSIELRPGVVTPGINGEGAALSVMGLPTDMKGMSVLDIGCWDGFYSFECEKRGADRVVASDIWHTSGREAFDFAHKTLGSKVIPREESVYDIDPEEIGRFYLVLFLGVLYHLKHPLLALEKVGECTKPGGHAIIDTILDFTVSPDYKPRALFHPGAEINNDPTTWWSFSPSGLAALLLSSNFSEVTNTATYSGNRGVFYATKATDEMVAEIKDQDYRNEHRQINYGPRPGGKENK